MDNIISYKDDRLEIFPIDIKKGKRDIVSTAAAMAMLAGIIYIIFKLWKQFMKLEIEELNPARFIAFLQKKNILTIVIGMMIATNARDLVKSLTENFIMPLLEPVLPFLTLRHEVKIGPFTFKLGQLMSDIIMFLIHIYTIYIIVALFSQTNMDVQGPAIAV